MNKWIAKSFFLLFFAFGLWMTWWKTPRVQNPSGDSSTQSLSSNKAIARAAASDDASDLPLEQISFYEKGIKANHRKFKISVYARAPGARSMALSNKGTLFVGTGGLNGQYNRVYAILKHEGEAKPEEVKIILDDLDVPNGVAVRGEDLFVAEISRILRYPKIEGDLSTPPVPEVFNDTFPKDRHHGWKYIRFDSKGRLIVPVGAPCNVCEVGPDHAAIFRLSYDGKKKELIASGVRNTVGFNFYPPTGDLYFTNNGRDMLGDNLPPETLNRIPEGETRSLHFGFPFCHSGFVIDPEFAKGRFCNEFAKPVMTMPAHIAPLGMHFYTGSMLPPEYKNQGIIAEHGSWNRAKPQGYRLSLARTKDNGKTFSYETFAEGWLNQDKPWGRPVDVLEMKDGSLLVSDDFAGVIYKITYKQ